MGIIGLAVFVLLLFWLQSAIYKKYSFSNLDYRCYISKNEVFEGEEIELVEELINRKFLPIPWLKSEITAPRALNFAGAQSVVTDETRFVPSFFMLRGYQKVVRRWRLTCTKRGIYTVEKTVLVASDLLGRASFSKPMPVDATVVVLPRAIEPGSALVTPRYLQGDTIVPRQLIDDPFYIAGVRPYQQGDTLNRVHWGATARQQELMVKSFDYTSRQSLMVIMNLQSREFEVDKAMDPDLVERAIRLTAGIFQDTAQTHMPVGFATNGSRESETRTHTFILPTYGEEHIYHLLRTLAFLKLYSSYTFTQFLGMADEQINASDIVVVSACITDAIVAFARRKAAEGSHVRVCYVGRPMQTLPEGIDLYYLPETLEERRAAV